jgi:perosamine synthetase
MNPVIELSEKYNLKVIEDAAEMHGQEYYGKKCGSFGDISTVSFYPNKHITTGEGGMVFTDNDLLAERCRSIRNLCFVPEQRFIHYELGFNGRLSNLQAAVGLAQFERLEEFIAKKRLIGDLYQERLAGISSIQLPVVATSFAKNIYWVFGIVIKNDVNSNARNVSDQLSKYGIGTRPFFWSLHEQPVLKKYGYSSKESFPVSENLSRRGLYLPSGLALSIEQIDYVSDKVAEIFN